MRLIAFVNSNGQPAIGARIDANNLVDLTAAGLPDSLDELLRMGEAGTQAALEAMNRRGVVTPIEGLRYLPPVRQPSKALAIGLNYIDHAAESSFAPLRIR